MTPAEALANCRRGAIVSACGSFRYHLHRSWKDGVPWLLFVMLNPSTADASVDDATVRRCVAFALAHGFGGIEIVNLFAFRSSSPAALKFAGYPVGPDNDFWLAGAAEAAKATGSSICLAYGANVAGLERPQVVLPLLRREGPEVLHCLRITRSGYPQHPLYLPASCRLMQFNETTVQEAMTP